MTRDRQRRIATTIFVIVAGFAAVLLPDRAAADAPRTANGWKIKFDQSGSTPVISDGVLYVGSADGAVYALDPTTGGTKWRFQTGESLSPATSGPQIITLPSGTSIDDQIAAGMKAAEEQRSAGIRRVDMTPAVADGTVFVGSGDGSFYAIDAATGKKRWSYSAGPGMASSTSYPIPGAVLKNGTVYFVSDDGLHALDAMSGERKWMFETLQEIPIEQMNMGRKRRPSRPVAEDGVILLTAWPFRLLDDSPPKSFLYAVDIDSGKPKWVKSMDGLDISAPTTANGLVFVAVEEGAPMTSPSNRRTVYAFDAVGGQERWKLGTEGHYVTVKLLVAGNTLYCSTDKNLVAVDAGTGRQLWKFDADEITGNLLADGQHLYVVTREGSMAKPKDTLHALALSTGQRKWALKVNGSAWGTAIQDGVVYAGDLGVHAIDAISGKKLWSFKGTGRESAQLISGGRVYASSPTITYVGMKRVDQGFLCAVDAKTGKIKP